MSKEFVVRVGKAFIGKSEATKTRLCTNDIKTANRFTMSEAELMRCFAESVFHDDIIFIAHERSPDCPFDPKHPCEFVVVIGRRYLKAFKARQPQMTFFLDQAKRHQKFDACEVAQMLRLAWPERTVHAAHEATPFIRLERDIDGESESSEDSDRRDDLETNDE